MKTGPVTQIVKRSFLVTDRPLTSVTVTLIMCAPALRPRVGTVRPVIEYSVWRCPVKRTLFSVREPKLIRIMRIPAIDVNVIFGSFFVAPTCVQPGRGGGKVTFGRQDLALELEVLQHLDPEPPFPVQHVDVGEYLLCPGQHAGVYLVPHLHGGEYVVPHFFVEPWAEARCAPAEEAV